MHAFAEFCFSGHAIVSPSTAMTIAIKTNSSHLRRAINDARPHELILGLFESCIIDRNEYDSLEEFRRGHSAKSELVDKMGSTIERFLESNPSQLTTFITLAGRFGMLHGVSLMIKCQYGKIASVCTTTYPIVLVSI